MLNILNTKTILETKNVIRTLIIESENNDNLKRELNAKHCWQKWLLFNSKEMLILMFLSKCYYVLSKKSIKTIQQTSIQQNHL